MIYGNWDTVLLIYMNYKLLQKNPRKYIAKLLKGGFTSGFKINYTGPRLPLDTKKIKFV